MTGLHFGKINNVNDMYCTSTEADINNTRIKINKILQIYQRLE